MKDQELVNALREHAEWARANEWECPITLGDDSYTAIQRLEQMPQWIPVTERLPECLACPDFVDKAQDDLEAFYGRADNG